MRPNKKNRRNASCMENARLKALARRLLEEIETLDHKQLSETRFPLDFYDEVRHFEIELITRALTHSHGHQLEAAAVINLNPSTLNAKIKQYNIQLNAFNELNGQKNGKDSLMPRLEKVEKSR